MQDFFLTKPLMPHNHPITNDYFHKIIRFDKAKTWIFRRLKEFHLTLSSLVLLEI